MTPNPPAPFPEREGGELPSPFRGGAGGGVNYGKGSDMKIFIAILAGLAIIFAASGAGGAEVEIPSSFNPVGSGARAIGRGGAFIAIADDATAASWNPGGLTQLKTPEASMVVFGVHRKEDNNFGTNPEADGLHSISETDVNYLSAAYPFELFNRNMVVSLSYQRLYDFTRNWNFILSQPTSDSNWNYEQDGSLSALGLSYCIRLIPQLSMGFTLNIWNNDLTPNKWEQKYQKTESGLFGSGHPYLQKFYKHETYTFEGVNANIGILWRLNYRLTIGAVLKTPFNAEIEHRIRSDSIITSDGKSLEVPQNYTLNEELKMPMSYGIGFAYNFSDHVSISGDIYKTEWNTCVYKKENGQEVSPFSGSEEQPDISPSYQMRLGAEYVFIQKEKGYIIPIRAGIFYDPAPSAGSPDNIYGFSLGAGFTKNNRFSIDIAYQYRIGNDVGKLLLPHFQFSQDISEHTLYLSAILYKF